MSIHDDHDALVREGIRAAKTGVPAAEFYDFANQFPGDVYDSLTNGYETVTEWAAEVHETRRYED